MNKQPEPEPESLRLLLKAYLEDIRHAKNQQWLVAYYGLLIQAAIVGFYQVINPELTDCLTTTVAVLLTLVSLISLTLGLAILWNYNKELYYYRTRKQELKEKLQLSHFTRQPKHCSDTLVTSTLTFVLAAGAVATSFLLIYLTSKSGS